MPAVVILGGHRCGTSMLAGIVHHLSISAAMPGDFIPASPSNPRGHFEDRRFVAMHEALLAPKGWRDPHGEPRPLDGALQQQYRAHLAARARHAQRWAIKDPRLCRLLPVLEQELAECHQAFVVVAIARSPESAAASLVSRNRLHPDHARDIAERDAAGRIDTVARLRCAGTPVMELHYEDAINDGAAAVHAIADFLQQPVTSDALSFVAPELCHHSGIAKRHP